MILNSVFVHRIDHETMYCKVMADGLNWREITIPLEELNHATFWDKVKELVAEAPIAPSENNTLTCPVCQAHNSTFLREFKARYFCGFCGTHLRYQNDKLEVILTL